MNPIPSEMSEQWNDAAGFSFFPSQRMGSRVEGRDPHALLKEDPLALQFPTERQIGVFLFLASLALYLA